MAFTPYLTVRNASAAIDFYKAAFGATEQYRIEHGGAVGHAELTIGGSMLMLSDEFPEMDVLGPETRGGSAVCLHLYVPDVDAVVARAVAAGAKILRPVEDQFYGDRGGKIVDPFGHVWWFATHKEDVSPEEIKRRAAALYGA
jgi:PhnB protein